MENKALSTNGLVATIGRIQAAPGVSNVIAGEVSATLDLRHGDDAIRLQSIRDLKQMAAEIADRRGLGLRWEDRMSRATTPMDRELVKAFECAVEKSGVKARRMASGAGHDAMVLAPLIPSVMLFLRSPGGLSHHPAETVLPEDVEVALRAGRYLLEEMVSA